MSFKDFSIAHKVPAKDGPADKAKEAAASTQPAPAPKPAAKP